MPSPLVYLVWGPRGYPVLLPGMLPEVVTCGWLLGPAGTPALFRGDGTRGGDGVEDNDQTV